MPSNNISQPHPLRRRKVQPAREVQNQSRDNARAASPKLPSAAGTSPAARRKMSAKTKPESSSTASTSPPSSSSQYAFNYTTQVSQVLVLPKPKGVGDLVGRLDRLKDVTKEEFLPNDHLPSSSSSYNPVRISLVRRIVARKCAKRTQWPRPACNVCCFLLVCILCVQVRHCGVPILLTSTHTCQKLDYSAIQCVTSTRSTMLLHSYTRR